MIPSKREIRRLLLKSLAFGAREAWTDSGHTSSLQEQFHVDTEEEAELLKKRVREVGEALGEQLLKMAGCQL